MHILIQKRHAPIESIYQEKGGRGVSKSLTLEAFFTIGFPEELFV